VTNVTVTGPAAGNVLQTVDGRNNTLQTLSTTIVYTNPMTNTSGMQCYSTAITPQKTTSMLEVEVIIWAASGNSDWQSFGLFRDTGTTPIVTSCLTISAGWGLLTRMYARVPSNSLATTTFTVRGGGNTYNIYIHSTNGSQTLLGNTQLSGIIIREVG